MTVVYKVIDVILNKSSRIRNAAVFGEHIVVPLIQKSHEFFIVKKNVPFIHRFPVDIHLIRIALQVCIVNTRGISRAPFGKSVWHYKQLFDIRPINPYREKAFAVIDPVGDNTINFNNMMTKFGAGFFDERDSVLAELLNAFGRDDFRHGQKSAVIRSHNIIDFFKIAFYGCSDDAEIADDSCIFVF